LKVVRIQPWDIDTIEALQNVNQFLASIPAEDVLDVKFQTYVQSDGVLEHQYQAVMIVYKTEK